MFGRQTVKPRVEEDHGVDPKLVTMTDERRAQILVVDDEQMLLDMVSDALSFAGYDIVVAADVVDGARCGLAQHGVNGRRVIPHVNPVAHMHAIAVDGQGLLLEGVGDLVG